jgi:hypothetical protein
MPFRIDAGSLPGGLHIVLSGPVSVEDRAGALAAALEWLPRNGPKRILVDFRDGWAAPAPFEASNRHAANLARHYTELGGARIAYLSRPEHRDPSPVELLAAARGYFYQRFTDHAAALHWLGIDVETAAPAEPG